MSETAEHGPLSDEQWKLLLHTCRNILGKGEWRVDHYSPSCCYFLLSNNLETGDLVYHKAGILGEEEMMNDE